jgi:WD40 repeat protein
VVVDQAEELLVRSGVPEQQAFLHLLKGALGEDCPLWAVATMRSEYFTAAPDRAGLAEAIDDPLIVEPLSRARLGEVILRPAHRAGLEFDPGLVERMVEDTSGGDALPLLAYTLHELCQRAGPDGHVSMNDYAAVGGVIGALRGRADRLAEELSRRGDGELVISTLTRLANVTGEGEPTRRRVRRSALSADEQMVVDAFVDASLLISGQNSADPNGEPIVEVAHEALLRQWRPLREAIETGRTELRLRSELEQLAAEWQQAGLDKAYLLRGGRLDVFDAWTSRNDSELGALERAFMEASRALAERKLKAIRRTNTRLRVLAAGLAVLLIVALAAGGLAWQQNRQAQAQARLAWSRQLAVQADRLVSTRPDMAILVGLQSLSLARGQESTPPAGLVSGLARVTHASWVVGGHTGPVRDVAFSPNSGLLATASIDRSVRFWDTATGQSHGAPLAGHTGGVWGVAFSPDGRLLATASADQTVRLWDPATGQPHGSPLAGHTGGVWVVAFSPDGRLLATAGADRTVRLWDPATGRSRGPPLTGHTDAVYGLAFSPDGRLLATTSGDQTVRLWDPATGRPHGPPLTGHTDEVNDVAFSPNGQLLATASTDRTVRLWDPVTGQAHGPPLTGHNSGVWGMAFSPDGRLLATASADQTVRLWDPTTGQPHGPPLTGHTDRVTSVAFSPDGRLLASTSGDQTVRLWDPTTGQPHGPPLTGHTDWVNAVAFSPDGRKLATGSSDQMTRLWNPAFDSWLTAGCTLVNRNLAMTEWNQLAQGLPYQRTCPDFPPGPGAPPDASAASYSRRSH